MRLFVGLLVWGISLSLSIAGVCARQRENARFSEPYVIDGLSVGAQVAPGSDQYRRYKCEPSDQYKASITCRITEKEEGITKSTTILHQYNNVVNYINKSVYPALFDEQGLKRELGRLSERFGSAPRIYTSRRGIIAVWGLIELQSISSTDIAALADDRHPKLGFLVDYLMNFHASAKQGLPVYRLSGGKGFVWIARPAFENEEGALRFLTADPSQMQMDSVSTAVMMPQPPAAPTEKPSPPTPPSDKKSTVSTGTGFFVSSEGHVITNAHVVEDCTKAQIVAGLSSPQISRILARDSSNDLALLKIDQKPDQPPSIRAGVKVGENIAAFGFPLVGLLSTTGNFTTGNVSAITGMRDDSRFFQISAPVQPGNSGGPVLDQNGNVVGVVVAKLNALKILLVTEDVAQNVNFAIKATTMMNFLDVNGIGYSTATSAKALTSPELAERAKALSVLIRCEAGN